MIRADSFFRAGVLMERFRAHVLVDATRLLSAMQYVAPSTPSPQVTHDSARSITIRMEQEEKPVPSVFRESITMLRDLREECVKLDLKASLTSVGVLLDFLADDKTTMYQIREEADQLSLRLSDELVHTLCFTLDLGDQTLVEGKNLFGDEVTKQFPSAAIDTEEACKCLAFGRSTACVFHLMRVMEVGLRMLAVSLNDLRLDSKTNPTWHNILAKGDEELKKPIAQRAPEWRADDQFFSAAQANLRAVQFAWRNPTMHVDVNYDKEKAADVMNCVKGFMRHLATKLRE